MLTARQIQKAVRAAVHSRGALSTFNGVSIDSRTLKSGNLFVAIQGPRFDGHRFVREAAAKGADGVVVSRSKRIPSLPGVTVFRVKDTTRALGDLAAFHRRQFKIPVIAVTGSVGKTTTKDLIAGVLGARFSVLKSVKTENNYFGAALTLLKLRSVHRAAVLELGTNHPGEMRGLARMVRPGVVVFTNAGESHLEGFGSVEGVFREKVQLVEQRIRSLTVVFNADDPYWGRLRKKKLGPETKKIGFGFHSASDFKCETIDRRSDLSIRFRVRGMRGEFVLQTPAVHNVHNALAAIACGRFFNIPVRRIQKALSGFVFAGGRQQVERAGHLRILNDSYNANPVSFQSALKVLNDFPAKGRKLIVCGDMLELGTQTKTLHRRLGALMRASAVDTVFSVGNCTRYLTNGRAAAEGEPRFHHCRRLSDLHRRLKKMCGPGDVILVKGSRGMRLERTVDFLKKEFDRPAG